MEFNQLVPCGDAPKTISIQFTCSDKSPRQAACLEKKLPVWIGGGSASPQAKALWRTPGIQPGPASDITRNEIGSSAFGDWAKRSNGQASCVNDVRCPAPPSHDPYDWGWLGAPPSGRWIIDRGLPRCVEAEVTPNVRLNSHQEGTSRTSFNEFSTSLRGGRSNLSDGRISVSAVPPKSPSQASCGVNSHSPSLDSFGICSSEEVQPTGSSANDGQSSATSTDVLSPSASRRDSRRDQSELPSKLALSCRSVALKKSIEQRERQEGGAKTFRRERVSNAEIRFQELKETVEFDPNEAAEFWKVLDKQLEGNDSFEMPNKRATQTMLAAADSPRKKIMSPADSPRKIRIPGSVACALRDTFLKQTGVPEAESGEPSSPPSSLSSPQHDRRLSNRASRGASDMLHVPSVGKKPRNHPSLLGRSPSPSMVSLVPLVGQRLSSVVVGWKEAETKEKTRVMEKHNVDLKIEMRRLRDKLYHSDQAAFPPDVWEGCGAEADHVKRHQFAQLIGANIYQKNEKGETRDTLQSSKNPTRRRSAERRAS